MKRGVIILFSLVLLVSFISLALADDNSDKAYTCLKSKLGTNCADSNSPVDQVAFSLLAMGYDSSVQGNCASALTSKESDAKCWPKSSCTVKDTALSVLALEYVGQSASDSEKWLLDHTGNSDLSWYLEIDAPSSTNTTTCTIKYDNSTSTQNTITINSEKKLTLSGSCFSLANSNYWLRIDSSCLGKNFKVSCGSDFITTLLYKKSDSDTTWHVSSKTQSASSGGQTENKVDSLCSKQNSVCNYESTLWTTLALQKNNDISSFLPYLVAFADDNDNLNPASFLYILTGADEYPNTLRSTQATSGFWDLSSSYGKFYDTALSLLALQQSNEDTATKGKDWLFSVQDSAGCWNNGNIRDTAFLLYAGWPNTPTISEGEIDYCEDAGKNCSSRTECIDAGGSILDNFACRSSLKICCSVAIIEKTCSDKNGVKCASDETCSGDLVSSADSGNCCVSGTCAKPETPGCEQGTSFRCKTSCSSTEEEKVDSAYDCSGSTICCGEKVSSPSYWWLWLLIILIILIALAIVFRNHFRLWFFQIKNKFTKGPVNQTRPGPGFPPAGSAQQRPMPMMRPMLQQRPMSRPAQQQQRPVQKLPAKPQSKSDKELDDTLRKLREMSK